MKTRFRGIFSALVFLLFAVSAVMGAEELTWQEAAGELMSPACPGRLLVDCPSGEAEQLRTLVKQKVADGWTKEQIKGYFVKLYGEEVLAAPSKRGFYLLAWIVPFAALAVGALVVFLVVRIWRRRGELEEQAASAPHPEVGEGSLSEKLDEELKEFDF